MSRKIGLFFINFKVFDTTEFIVFINFNFDILLKSNKFTTKLILESYLFHWEEVPTKTFDFFFKFLRGRIKFQN